MDLRNLKLFPKQVWNFDKFGNSSFVLEIFSISKSNHEIKKKRSLSLGWHLDIVTQICSIT